MDYEEPNKEEHHENHGVPHIQHKKEKLTAKMRQNPWILSTLVLGVLSLILISGSFFGAGMTGNVISGDVASNNLVSYLNTVADSEVTLIDTEDSGSMYLVTVGYQGDEVPLYVTKDGKSYTPSLVPMVQVNTPGPTGNAVQQPQDVPKSDKPKVELFVMTHCPYGTQAEKGFLPTIVALGDKIDSSVKFVHYFLHEPENDETPVQICIREEQGDKYNSYLKEFLVAGDTNAALAKVGIDENKLDDCIATKYDGYYASDSVLSEGYGVRGSPTLVINGQIVNSGRSADAYLQTICNAFNNAPSECTTLELDTASPSPGFGYGTTSSVANAQC